MAFYEIDPWGDQRDDMRMARLATTIIQPHLKPGAKVNPADYMLYPEDALELPEDVDAQERAWMLTLGRAVG